jgi:hypothetical protein
MTARLIRAVCGRPRSPFPTPRVSWQRGEYKVNSVASYLALAYVSHTVGKAFTSLLPIKSTKWRTLARDWFSTAAGVSMAWLGEVDMLGDVGLDLNLEPLGYLVTGFILGHGTRYAMSFLNRVPSPPR